MLLHTYVYIIYTYVYSIYLIYSALRCYCFRIAGTPLALPYQSSLKLKEL